MWKRVALTFIILANSAAAVYFENVKFEAQVTNHLSETTLVMKIHNTEACPTQTTFDLQLPATSFLSEMILTEEKTNCTFAGEFLPFKKAQAGFDGAVSAGKSAALIKSYALGKVTLSLSVPANATSSLKIAYTEVLRKERGQVRLRLPINLGRRVEGDIKATIRVRELSGVKDLTCSSASSANAVQIRNTASEADESRVSIFIPNSDQVVAGSFTTTINCAYTPNALPNGLLLVDPTDRHFFYLYAPPTPISQGRAVSKAISFVIDVSGSMAQGTRIKDAKVAFKYMVKLLSPEDYFSVSTFSSTVHVADFGPSLATPAAIQRASSYIDSLSTGGGTNLDGAVVQGIAHARSLLASAAAGATPLLLLLTDGQASAGETNRREIVKNAIAANDKAKPRVPLYALALGSGADYQLLGTLTTLNSGDTLRVYEGFGDSIDQMRLFYDDNLKHILLRQVEVELGGAEVQSNTDVTFPILNAGTEVMVTGQLDPTVTSMRRGLSGSLKFGATIKGFGPDGAFSLTTTAILTSPGIGGPEPKGLLARMHTYRKVRELMRHSDADTMMGLTDSAQKRRAEALNMTLETGLLWPGLTSMLVVADDTCQAQMKQISAECQKTTPLPLCENPDGCGRDGDQEDSVPARGLPSQPTNTQGGMAPPQGGSTVRKSEDVNVADDDSVSGEIFASGNSDNVGVWTCVTLLTLWCYVC